MIWAVIAVVFLVIFLVVGAKTGILRNNYALYALVALWILAAVTFIFMLTICCEPTYTELKIVPEAVETVSVQRIMALQDTAQAHGRSFLGTGTYQGTMYYYYYIETEEGYTFNKISPENETVFIKYIQDNSVPRIEKTVEHKRLQWILKKEPSFWRDFFAWRQYKEYSVGDICEEHSFTSSKFVYTIYVPEGSIVEKYDIDLQ